MKTNFYGFVSGTTNRERERERTQLFSSLSTTDTNPPFSKNKPNRISHKRQQKKRKKLSLWKKKGTKAEDNRPKISIKQKRNHQTR